MTGNNLVTYEPPKYTLTRIIEEFEAQETYKQRYMTIVKNYVYLPKKKLIA
jgi:hypothetical protein